MPIKLLVAKASDPETIVSEQVFDKVSIEVGRSPTSDLVLTDPENRVSRLHAKFELLDGSLAVRDFGSTNGTHINGVRMETKGVRLISPTDQVKVGGFVLRVSVLTTAPVKDVKAGEHITSVTTPTSEVPRHTAKVETSPNMADAPRPEAKAPTAKLPTDRLPEDRPSGSARMIATDNDELLLDIAPKDESKASKVDDPLANLAGDSVVSPDDANEPLPTDGASEPVSGSDPLAQAALSALRKISAAFLGEASFTTPEQVRLFGDLVEQTLDVSLDWLNRSLQGRKEFEGQFEAFVTMAFKQQKNPMASIRDAVEARRWPLDWRKSPKLGETRTALEEAYRKLTEHQLGMLSGVQEALGAVMRRMDPRSIEESVRASARGLSGILAKFSMPRHAWKHYVKLYAEELAESSKLFNQTVFPHIRKGYLAEHSRQIEKRDSGLASKDKIEAELAEEAARNQAASGGTAPAQAGETQPAATVTAATQAGATGLPLTQADPVAAPVPDKPAGEAAPAQ